MIRAPTKPSGFSVRMELSSYKQDVYIDTYKSAVTMAAHGPGGSRFVVWMSAREADLLAKRLIRAATARRALDAYERAERKRR